MFYCLLLLFACLLCLFLFTFKKQIVLLNCSKMFLLGVSVNLFLFLVFPMNMGPLLSLSPHSFHASRSWQSIWGISMSCLVDQVTWLLPWVIVLLALHSYKQTCTRNLSYSYLHLVAVCLQSNDTKQLNNILHFWPFSSNAVELYLCFFIKKHQIKHTIGKMDNLQLL